MSLIQAVGVLALCTFTVDARQLRGQNQTSHSFVLAKQPACTCQAGNDKWVQTKRTKPKCIFIDLGAADGNSFGAWMSNKYGDVGNCPSGGSYEAFLVEANPRFKGALDNLEKSHKTQDKALVHSLAPNAAYMCEGKTSFYLDTVNHEHNYWGSSMSSNHHDVKESGYDQVTVSTVNLNKLLAENTIKDDFVLVKMDVEGAEFDILPCLANSPHASLIDKMLVEYHPINTATKPTTWGDIEEAKRKLTSKGVMMPDYSSPTL